MAAVANLITERSNDFQGSVGSWTTNAPHLIVDSREFIRFQSKGVMKVVAGSSSTVNIAHPTIPVGDNWGWEPRFFLWAWAPVAANVTLQIQGLGVSDEIATHITGLRPFVWTLCSVEGTPPLQGSQISLGVQVSGLNVGEVAFLTNPVLFFPDTISKNLFAAETWNRLPQFMRDADEVQVEPDYPLLRFMDVVASQADALYELYEQFLYIPPEDDGDEYTPSLLDPSVAPVELLRWWAQILGVRMFDPSVGSTTWGTLESSLNPGGSPTWGHWETVPDTADVGTDVSWEEIEQFAPGTAGLLDLLRWQIQTAYFGFRGGTKEAIVESVKRILSDSKTVMYNPHYGGDPWVIQIQTLSEETPEHPAPGATSQTVLDMVANAVPAGYTVVHSIVGGDNMIYEDADDMLTEDGDTYAV